MNGIYYDGIAFDRVSMRRIGKANLAASAGGFTAPQFDLHTGHTSAPPFCSYAYVYPYVQKGWNGEGFDFGSPPEYWLVEVSLFAHGLAADRLGGSSNATDFRGMLFASTQRNYATSPALWAFWDDVSIQDTALIGWWDADSPVSLAYMCGCTSCDGRLLATSYVAYGSHAVVAVGSWCDAESTLLRVPVTGLDWETLGLSASSVTYAVPGIDGLQDSRDLAPDADGSLVFNLPANVGVIFVIAAAGAA